MTTLYIGAIGTILFLILTIVSFVNKRFGSFISFWKYPLFVLPLVIFAWLLSTKLYIPFKGNGCSYTESQSIIESKSFSANKKSGVLMLFIDGFKNSQISVTMKSGKSYSAKSLNNLFALVLPSDSGQVNFIQVGENADTIPGKIQFAIKPGKLTYLGTIVSPKGFIILIPGMACKATDYSYKAPSDVHLSLVKDWADAGRLVLPTSIKDRMTELQKNYNSASQIIGLQIGLLPYNSTLLNGKALPMTADEVLQEYKKYKFLIEASKGN